MCIAGVFGGKDSGVSNETKSIFLESAYFSPVYIRKTSQFHGLKTDASFRYERGTDPEITLYALKKAALLIKQIAGGEISSDIIDIYPHKIEDFKISVSYNKINNLIGKEIAQDKVISILKGLNIKIVSNEGGKLDLIVPSYKVDVRREADIVEEILRIYGYNNIELSNSLQASYLADFPERDKVKFIKTLSSVLTSKGFFETITNSLTSSAYPTSTTGSQESVKVLNALSEGLDVLRTNLLFSGLEVIAHNINRRNKDLKLFEFGKTYFEKDLKYLENERLSLLITGDKYSENWQNKSEPVDLFYLKQTLSEILTKVGILNYTIRDSDNPFFSSAITIEKNSKEIVTFGQVKSAILKSFSIKQDVFYADFDFEYLFKNSGKGINFNEIAKYPEVRRDLSIVMDKNVTFDQIKALAIKQEKRLIKDINVFDIYEGDKIEKGKKSYSVSFTLQDFEQTLTDKVIDKTMQNLINAFEKELGGIIRK
jgi:phenylalanyl-tRNA synthetase beta chain